MATKSFFKSVNITTAEQAQRLADALEKAEQLSSAPNISSDKSNFYEVKGDDVGEFIKKIRWQERKSDIQF